MLRLLSMKEMLCSISVSAKHADMCSAYGIIVLLVEILGASTVVVYGVNLLFETVAPEPEVSSPCFISGSSCTPQPCAVPILVHQCVY